MTRIAIASCAKYRAVPDQPVWSRVQAQQPDALLLLGDNIYLKHDEHLDPDALRAELRELYDQQLAEPHFAALLNALHTGGKPILSTYDDHDFLGNDRCGVDNPTLRDIPRDELIAALNPPMTGDEVYSVCRMGDVDVIVLDCRYHRSKYWHVRQQDNGMLGEKQWDWLEECIRRSTARYVLVATATNFHKIFWESWQWYPKARDRLRELLNSVECAVVVSGDVHANSLCDESGIIELITSGVARNDLLSGRPLANYAILEFGEHGLRVEMHGLESRDQCQFTIRRDNWQLPPDAKKLIG